MNILKYKGYDGTAELVLDKGVCRGKILFIDDLVTYETADMKQIEAEFRAAVDDYIETCKELNRDPLKPLSGTFNVRVEPELHREAKLRAIDDGVSLNEVVARAIHCYLHGDSRVTNHHSHNYVVYSPEQHFDTYSAVVAADELYRGAISRVVQ
ncbi:type II toxin-antitoxin system HicB family antitoxin [Xanthomonas sp. A1809]|uniref:type II toxin-antitoxin system HicB family antitoxin n=1 Tax=Xanthomonas sp. A1809 TaxID=2821275 RepID=UPI001ADA607A|nr:type II toxin-antitoxin system HicB family antitoxin [Xanthomonas sp. A1809]MBO9859281.1 type II toxin-antitoxin system HicB family antitoxin [Xanthomonas sp. A1809]